MKGGLATVVVSGSIGRNRVHAVFQKPLKSGKFTGAFAADIGPIKLSDLIKKQPKWIFHEFNSLVLSPFPDLV